MDTLDDPSVLIPDILASHAEYFPDREAVICGTERRTWGQFHAGMERVARALAAAGVGRGQQVAVMMGNSVTTLELIFGVVRAGACVVPLSGLLTGEQLAGLLDDSQAVLAFAGPEFRAKLAPHRAACPDIGQAHWISVLGNEPGWRSLEDFLAGAPGVDPPLPAPRADDRFNIIYSSGTTGLPKGIVQTHRARTHWAYSNALELGMNSQSRALTTTALYSNGTWLMILPVLFVGGTCVVMESFNASAFLKLVARERISHSFMVPAQYLMLLAEPQLEAADTSSLQSLLCAGSPLRRDTKREVLRRLGNKLTELYGLSEGFATMLKPHQHAAHFDSVGTPVLGFELRILDDAGRVLPRGQTGEIAGYGAGMMSGYHRRPEASAELIWRDERGRSFIRSGDIGRLDEHGFLHIVERKKDMIISGGFNIFPTDIEAVVARYPGVQDVTVIGVPHATWGETPLALMILKPGAPFDAVQALDWCNQRLARHQRISAIEVRQDFPRNALGKVLKRQLREPYWAQAGRKL